MVRIEPVIRILLLCVAGYLTLLIGCALFQRKLIYIPTHHLENSGLTEWKDAGQLIGYARQVASPETIWLFLHGNAGQASDRTYVLPSFSSRDSVFILEYPGYGSRPGSPSMSVFNDAARRAFELLKAQFPHAAICVAAESIGCGPAAYLASNPLPPDKIVLILPFDTLAAVAGRYYPFLPVKLLLRDNWDNVNALRGYKGQLELIAAKADTIIPIIHAKTLADSIPAALFHTIEGDHNEWADGGKVKIQYARQAGNRQ